MTINVDKKRFRKNYTAFEFEVSQISHKHADKALQFSEVFQFIEE